MEDYSVFARFKNSNAAGLSPLSLGYGENSASILSLGVIVKYLSSNLNAFRC